MSKFKEMQHLEILVRGYLAQVGFLVLQFFYDAREFEQWMARNQELLASKFDKKDMSAPEAKQLLQELMVG